MKQTVLLVACFFAFSFFTNIGHTQDDFIVPTSADFSVVSGITNENEILVRNTGNKTMKIIVETVCIEGHEQMCNWNWFSVDNKRSSNLVLELTPFENKTFSLYTLPPLSLTQVTYYIHLRFSVEGSSTVEYMSVTEKVELASVLEKTTKHLINAWNYELWGDFKNPIPFTNKNSLNAGDFALIIMIVFSIVWGAVRVFK